MPERGKIIEGEIFTRRNVEILAQLAEQLGLLNAVDAEVRFQVGIEFHDLRRIAGLLDDEADQELFQILAGGTGDRRGNRRRTALELFRGRQDDCWGATVGLPNRAVDTAGQASSGTRHGLARLRGGRLPHLLAPPGGGVEVRDFVWANRRPRRGRGRRCPLLHGLQGAAAFQQRLNATKLFYARPFGIIAGDAGRVGPIDDLAVQTREGLLGPHFHQHGRLFGRDVSQEVHVTDRRDQLCRQVEGNFFWLGKVAVCDRTEHGYLWRGEGEGPQ